MESIKTLALVFILISSWVNSNAQTKEETEKWIVEKINVLAIEKSYSYDINPNGERFISKYIFKPIKFTLQNDKIIITYSKTLKQFETNKWVTYSTSIESLSAKINSFEKITEVSYSNFKDGITSKETLHYGDPYLIIQLKCTCVEGHKNVEGKDALNIIPIFIDKNAEKDILSRLDKAFTQLKTFYPVPKETF